MTTVNEIEGHDIVFVKGAVDVLLKMHPPGQYRPPARDRVSRPEGQRRHTLPYLCRPRTVRGILDQNSRWSARGSGSWLYMPSFQ